jgi:hypothetical protein
MKWDGVILSEEEVAWHKTEMTKITNEKKKIH